MDAVSTIDGKSLSVALGSVGAFVLKIFSSMGAMVCGAFVVGTGAVGGTLGDTFNGDDVGERSGVGLFLVGLFVANGAAVIGVAVGDTVGDSAGAADVGEVVMGADVGIYTLV